MIEKICNSSEVAIALLAIISIAIHLLLKYLLLESAYYNWPLFICLILGGLPLVFNLLKKVFNLKFGSDLLAGISIVVSVLLGEYLAGVLVVLMLSGGEALEQFAAVKASFILQALAKRMPLNAHKKLEQEIIDIEIDQIQVGDLLVILPHEVAPVDGDVIDGYGHMDESYLTGEPYQVAKAPGAKILSGAINGEAALTIKANKQAKDSRYSKIVEVIKETQLARPEMKRLADKIGAYYTPFAIIIAAFAWWYSSDPIRFLSVLVVATPCPLLIAIPVAIIGAVSLAAKHGIIIRDPAVLERIGLCKTMILDKTGTLTYGNPKLSDQFYSKNFSKEKVLPLVASLEQFSKHPLAEALTNAAKDQGFILSQVESLSEKPGQGLVGKVAGQEVMVTSRKMLGAQVQDLPEASTGLECVIKINGEFAALYRFTDQPRQNSNIFVKHLDPIHKINRVLIVSGDREVEVANLAKQVGIEQWYAGQSPEQKVAIVKAETQKARTIYVGDGINDAPALLAATVGVAFGINSEVTCEAAGAVILDSNLVKLDQLIHISTRMRYIALQSAVGGIALSVLGMILASFGLITPVIGALAQEFIDLVAVLNALRVAYLDKFSKRSELSDF